MIDARAREHFEQTVLTRLAGLRRRVRWYAAVDGLALLSLLIVVAIVATFIVDRTLWLGRDMRSVQLFCILVGLGAAAWYWLIRPLRVPVGAQELALLVERRFPELDSRLITAVEFAAPDAAVRHSETPRSQELIDAVVRQAQRAFEPLPIRETLSQSRLRSRAIITGGAVVFVLALAIVAQGSMSLWFQRNVLLREVGWPLRHRLTVEGLTDGRIVVPKGDDLVITAAVDTGYQPPRQVFIEYAGTQGVRGRDQMPAVEGPTQTRFTYTFERVAETMNCRVYGGDAPAQSFTIEAVDRPQIVQVAMSVTPPAYTKLDPYELRAGQTVAEVLKGSRIGFSFTANKPLTDVVLVRHMSGQEKEVARLHATGGLFELPPTTGPASTQPSFKWERTTDETKYSAWDLPENSAGYYFRLSDAIGLSNISDRTPPIRLSVRLVADKPPKVRMKLKGVGEMITPEAILPVESDFADTYGLAGAYVVYEVPTREGAKPTNEPMPGFEAGTRTFAHNLEWSAATHALKEGDRVVVRAEATDFDNVSGPNVGQSASFTLRLVNREELLAELNRREQEYRQDFERLMRQQEELYSELLTLSAGPAAQDPDRSRRLTQLSRLQRDYAGRLGSMRLQFEQVLSELRVNQLSSPAAEARLGGGIVEPMNNLARTRMPEAADSLEHVSRDPSAEEIDEARAAQEAIRADMQRILASMLKWEGFQEAVALLREIVKMQGTVTQETEKRIEKEILGNPPATSPSHP